MANLLPICTICRVILNLGVLDNHEVLCEISDIFPWQEIGDSSKKFQLWRNENSLWHKQFLRIAPLRHICDIFRAISYDILCDLEFGSFWIITRCLARSQIFFLDKQSETCQKKFSSQEIITLCDIYNISKILHYATHLTYFIPIHMIYCVIWNLRVFG